MRLREYDYTDQGPYFITICTAGRAPLFGEIADLQMTLSPAGEVVAREWERTAAIRGDEIILDAFVVMPNHVHGIVTLVNPPEPDGFEIRTQSSSLLRRPGSLGAFVGGFKGAVTSEIRNQNNDPGMAVWQRNYYDHIIRNARIHDKIREYIVTNPEHWTDDRLHPNHPDPFPPEM